MVTLFSQGVIRAHSVLLLPHFLKSVLVWADPHPTGTAFLRACGYHLISAFPGLYSGFCKYLSTSGTEVKLSGEFAAAAVGRAFRKF